MHYDDKEAANFFYFYFNINIIIILVILVDHTKLSF